MATESNGTSRISVSEELLRAVLAEFKLELFTDLRNYATTMAVDSLSTAMHAAIEGLGVRVTALEQQNSWVRGGAAKGRQVSASTLAWATLAVAVLGAVVTLIWLTHG